MSDLSQYTEAFVLGNAAILTNVCVLPLYPGMIAFLAGTAQGGPRRGQTLLGWLVLAGVLSMMIALGLALYLINRSFSSILGWLLPVIYGVVIVLGLAMLGNRNPFTRLNVTRGPGSQNRFASAFTYGLLLGPMTLPCTGPLIISAFVLGAGSAASLAEGIAYFLAFGIGFGWPLVVLPLVTAPIQRWSTRWLTRHYTTIGRLSGLVLIVIGIFGFWA
jgi:cytochrome c-type biogenesis protein